MAGDVATELPTILHADLDCFFASVEQRDDPSLRGRPVAVGGGVVLAASYEAKAYGVRGAMGGRLARRLCPGLIVVPPRMTAYTEASRAVFEVFERTAPLVEGISVDEAFLDVGGLRRVSGTSVEIARHLRAEVRASVGLPISVGAAGTKFLAKVASAASKPDGLLVVPLGGELDFLHPLPIERLWGVGPKTSVKLRDRGIRTVGELAMLGEATLAAIVGKASARHLHALAGNRDPRHVRTGTRRGSIGSQRALGFARGYSAEEIDATLLAIVERVTGRMRAARRIGRSVHLRLRFDDLSRATRSHTMSHPTSRTDVVLAVARRLLDGVWATASARGLTLVGLSVGHLEDDRPLQLQLPFRGRDEVLDAAIDDIRDRFGKAALTRAVLVDRNEGISMPMLPD